ncbi:MAG: 3-deoxy-manno-octulosonate cytidylyltransferase [Acidiferrobacterales bacterium]
MIVIIPARFASTRLPGKPLADIGGKPMIERVYASARASGARRVVVATDDARISATVRGFGGEACMTAADHRSGTDRIAEAIAILGIDPDEIVVNLQGDEPLVPPALIRQVADTLLAHPQASMATACHAIHDRRVFLDPNVVKLVIDRSGFALYFSRAPIPWLRDETAGAGEFPVDALRHIGIYAYRAEFVSRYADWSPCPPERIESLEQLRVLWNGERIAVCETPDAPAGGVDTAEDLERVRAAFGRGR